MGQNQTHPMKQPKGFRARPRGRAVDPAALGEVRALLGDDSRARDLLLEHLHKLQDRYGCISAPHLVALAAEMKLAPAEVYEVANFYHHFDVVKEGEAPPPLTVRVCDSLSCEMFGAQALIASLKQALGDKVRIQPAPCVGRCEAAPVVDIHPEDLSQLGGAVGEPITVASWRGRITGFARADDRLQRGEVFIPFCYVEAATNLLTNEALDPFGKIPEFKYCAVKVTAGEAHA